MRYFKFIGTEGMAEGYQSGQGIPKKGEIYGGSVDRFSLKGNTVEHWATESIFKSEWEEVFKFEGYNGAIWVTDRDLVETQIKDRVMTSNFDEVLRPAHYNQAGVECIEAIKSATANKNGVEAVCVGNIIKYLWRYEEKGTSVKDLKKAKWYLERLIQEVESE
jgi:hypothetical protein